MTTYHYAEVKPGDKCWECGEDATIKLVADECESETGYVDEIALCEDCLEGREK